MNVKGVFNGITIQKRVKLGCIGRRVCSWCRL